MKNVCAPTNQLDYVNYKLYGTSLYEALRRETTDDEKTRTNTSSQFYS